MQDNRILAELEHPRTTGPSHHMASTSHTANTVLSNTLSSSTVPTCLSSYSANYISSLSTTGGLGGTASGSGLASVLSAGTAHGGLSSASAVSGLGTTSLSGAAGGMGTSSALGKSALDRATAGVIGGGVTSSVSSHALTSHYGDALSGVGGTLSGAGTLGGVSISTANVSPLPMRAQHMSTMPPMCQV